MCDFKCGICGSAYNDGSFVAYKYETWVNHLLSNGHQLEVRKKQGPRRKWKDEEDSFVLIAVTKSNGFPWALSELGEWLSTFGTLTQLLYNDKYYFCIFTLQGFGQMGKERVSLIVNQTEYKGHAIQIKPKSRFGHREWNAVFDEVDKVHSQLSTSSSRESIGKASKLRNDRVPANPKVPKGTLVFTNKNQSSSHNYQQNPNPKSANVININNNTQESLMTPKVGSSSKATTSSGVAQEQSRLNGKTNVEPEVSLGEKKRGKRRRRVDLENMENTVSVSEASREGTAEGFKLMVPQPLSSQIPRDTSTKINESAFQNQKEVLNFRGGFTPSRTGAEYRVSESSDCSYQPDAAVPENTSATTSILGKSSTLSQKVQILQRPNDFVDEGPKNQKHNGVQPHNSGKKGQSNKNQAIPIENHQPTPGPSLYQKPPPHSSRFQPNQQQHHYLISPVFASQVPPKIAPVLSNPARYTSKNPYTFQNMPPFPYFFDLFQKLTQESFKPQKEVLYHQFEKLKLAQQLEEFFVAQTLPFEEIRLRWQVIFDILFLLRQNFQNCELYAFGSIFSGLGDFMSDIDIYVDLEPHPIDPSRIKTGQEAVDIVRKYIRKALCPHNKTPFVKNLIPVKSARVPILKLTHLATEINCDLSFENRLSVQNTKLLSFYTNLDERIFRFMVLVRYWGKFHHLTGSNHIKNYGLMLLVLVYLTKKRYVPPVELLQRLKAAERKKQQIPYNPDEIDGWDASFCDNMSVIQQNFKAVSLPSSASAGKSNSGNNYISQTQTLIQMTMEFFEMYANLDFTKFVVCPLLGEVLPRKDFYPGSEENLPDTLDRYKNWAVKQAMNRRFNVKSYLCVQDPFVLSFNVGSVTPQGTLLQFQVACVKSLQILRDKNGLKSLLDVLVRLPPHIGEKKFMKTYKTEIKAKELKWEIKRSVLNVNATEEENPSQLSSSSSSSLQTSSSITLPPHLKSYEKLIDEKGLKKAARKPRWEIFIDFSLSSQFEDTLIAELTRCQLINKKRSELMDFLTSLWETFTLDFLSEFFETGLKLSAAESKEVFTDSYDSSKVNADNKAKASGEDEGKRKRWKVKMLSKQDEDRLVAQSVTLAPRSPQDANKLSLKLCELPKPSGKIHYRVVTFKVTYPFWEKRPTLLDRVVKNIKPEEMVKIPVFPSGTKRSRKERRGKEKSSKNGEKEKKKEKQTGDEKSGHWKSFNPVDLEAKVSEMVLENFKRNKGENKDFTEFQIDLLVKLETSVNDRPEIFFLFEMDPKCNPNDYLRAIQCLSNILTDAFPCYQVYRLARWLDMPSPDDFSKSDNISMATATTSSSTKNEQDVREGTDEANINVVESTEKKKSTRSKLEEDLLIPSSSSSTCSNDENEDNGLEDISNDENDGDSDVDSEDQRSDNEGAIGED